MIVDLHCHTTASDGALAPAELVSRAVEKGVGLLAITDHDTVKGFEEAQLSALKHCSDEHPIKLISGIEISTRWDNKVDIHVVGLGFDPKDARLLERLETQEHTRRERAEEIVQRLSKLGYSGADDWLDEQGVVTPGRPHFAKFLVQKGAVKDVASAFKKYLAMGKPAYVATNWCSVEDSIQWIADAGGVSVLAHPGKYKMTHTKLRRLASCFASAGGDALEVVSGLRHRDEVNRLAKLTEDLDLKASVGSDFHRPGEAWQELGKMSVLPKTCHTLWDHAGFLEE
ncbi:MAG: PHP domain-containing protein [Pseudomonadales bacterium]|nr:PHP domain-containing protein [Pseudomonadales bacterium]